MLASGSSQEEVVSQLKYQVTEKFPLSLRVGRLRRTNGGLVPAEERVVGTDDGKYGCRLAFRPEQNNVVWMHYII